MSKDLRSTAEVNQKVIVALSGLTEERLKIALLRSKLVSKSFDVEYGKEEGSLSPEEFFEAFAAHEKYGLGFSCLDDSSLADLDTPTIYLAAAWNFKVDIATISFFPDAARTDGQRRKLADD